MRKFDVFWIEILRKIGCVRKVPNANKLIKIANDLVDNDRINLDKLDTISYLRDITNNKIYWKNDNQEIEVGKWIGDYFEDDEKIMDKRIEFY